MDPTLRVCRDSWPGYSVVPAKNFSRAGASTVWATAGFRPATAGIPEIWSTARVAESLFPASTAAEKPKSSPVLGAFRIERVGRLTDRQPADRHSPDHGLEVDGVAVGVTARAVSLAAPVKRKTMNRSARTVTRGCGCGCGNDRVLRASQATTWISFQTIQH